MIDTHAHLDDKKFNDDREEIIGQCKEKLKHVFLPASLPGTAEANWELAQKHKGFLYSMGGLDPMSCLKNPEKISSAMQFCIDNDVLAIGEVGLEYHHAPDKRKEQRENFREWIKLANELQRPLVIHTREAWKDTFEELSMADINVIIHCFSGNREDIKACEDRGYTISLATNICYPQNANLIKLVPLDIIVFETDSPYLQPYRKGRNVPTNVWETAKMVAEDREINIDELSELTDRNALKVFEI